MDDLVPRPEPTKIENLPEIQAIWAGHTSSYFLDIFNCLWCCGTNKIHFAQNINHLQQTPVQITVLPPIKMVRVGLEFTIVLDMQGAVWFCGQYEEYYTNPSATFERIEFATSGVPPRILEIAAGSTFALLLDENQQVWSCGDNFCGQLGTSKGSSKIANLITYLPPIVTVQAGALHSIFVDANGVPWVCGSNSHSQLGFGRPNRPRATKVPNLVVKSAYAGFNHTLYVDLNREVWSCGQLNPTFVKNPPMDKPNAICVVPEVFLLVVSVRTKSARS